MAVRTRKLRPGPETTGDSARAEIRWGVWDDAGAAVTRGCHAVNAAVAALDPWHEGLKFQGLSLSQESRSVWHVSVMYGPAGGTALAEDESEISFDFQGQTQHITVSRETVDRYVKTGTPENYQQLIGWDGRRVQGTDIYVPGGSFRIRKAYSSVTSDALRRAMLWAGSVNDRSFTASDGSFSMTFEAGEVLYAGLSGGKRAGAMAELTAHFVVSFNAEGERIGPITGVDKRGWDHLWVAYARKAEGKWLTPQPRQVSVERVYPYRDLAELGF